MTETQKNFGIRKYFSCRYWSNTESGKSPFVSKASDDYIKFYGYFIIKGYIIIALLKNFKGKGYYIGPH